MEKEIYLKLHKSQGERILAACDQEILGKKFSEGNLKLEVKKNFYKGTLTPLEELGKKIPQATIVNLAGNAVVNFALEKNLVKEGNVLIISNIKHAQIVSL